ncbi:transposase, IS481 family [Bordetella pertussis STO1-CHOC-0018]|nr:transposase, IS481 family [Bordetella pertussis STO1-CHOC-0018]
MNTHKHARLTFLRRLEMVQQLIAHQVCVPEAARAYGVTAPTVRKWLGRFLAQGQAGLADASSRPTVSPRAIAPAKALAIVELRRKRLTQARIAQALGVSASTVSRVLARAGLSHLADLEPAEPVVRYEHQAPGDLLHIDIKKLGRIQRPGHRVTGNRRDTVEGAGWDFVFVAIDDHARVAFTDIHPDERFPSAVQFLKDAVAYYQRLGVTIQRLLTDNGSAFRSRAFAALCHELGIKHRFTRPYRPQTNGKAERFIQSALREWAYAHTYQNSQHRADAMKSWLHHYNWHRPHHRPCGNTPGLRAGCARCACAAAPRRARHCLPRRPRGSSGAPGASGHGPRPRSRAAASACPCGRAPTGSWPAGAAGWPAHTGNHGIARSARSIRTRSRACCRHRAGGAPAPDRTAPCWAPPAPAPGIRWPGAGPASRHNRPRSVPPPSPRRWA